MTAMKRQARLAGVLYLALAVFSGLPFIYLKTRILESGDAAATARNVAENETLFRVAFVADLVGIACYVLVAMALYRLLKHVDKNLAAAMVTFVAVGAAAMCAALANHFAALVVATDSALAESFGRSTADGLVLLFLELRTGAYLVAQVFFGLWLVPLGYLAYRSGNFPRPLGVLLVVGCAGYLVDLCTRFLSPQLGAQLSGFVLIPAIVAEFWMVGYLLFKGVNLSRAPRSLPA